MKGVISEQAEDIIPMLSGDSGVELVPQSLCRLVRGMYEPRLEVLLILGRHAGAHHQHLYPSGPIAEICFKFLTFGGRHSIECIGGDYDFRHRICHFIETAMTRRCFEKDNFFSSALGKERKSLIKDKVRKEQV